MSEGQSNTAGRAQRLSVMHTHPFDANVMRGACLLTQHTYTSSDSPMSRSYWLWFLVGTRPSRSQEPRQLSLAARRRASSVPTSRAQTPPLLLSSLSPLPPPPPLYGAASTQLRRSFSGTNNQPSTTRQDKTRHAHTHARRTCAITCLLIAGGRFVFW